jgi:hypothetical protein
MIWYRNSRVLAGKEANRWNCNVVVWVKCNRNCPFLRYKSSINNGLLVRNRLSAPHLPPPVPHQLQKAMSIVLSPRSRVVSAG